MEQVTWIPNEALGITDEQVQEYGLTDADYQNRKLWQHFTPDFVNTKVQKLDLAEVYRQMDKSRVLFESARISQQEGEARFKTDLPVTVFGIGDLHFGSIFTDNDEVLRKLDLIESTPNAYMVLMSNLIDNAIPAQYPDGMLSNSIPPDKQVVAMRKIIQRLDVAGKVLAAVTSPCHEGWTFKKTGQDINALLFGFEGRRFPVLENGGRLSLVFPDKTYVAALYHMMGPFESRFNKTHANKQMNRLQQDMACDIIFGGHRHTAAAEMVFEGTGTTRRPAAYIRTGSEKGTMAIRDQWAVGRYGDTGEPTGASVTLLPRIGKMDHHLEFDTGILAQECYLLREMTHGKRP